MALHHVKPGEVADLAPLGSRLCDTKTSALAKSNSFEAIRLVVPAGKEIPAHDVPGEITLHCLEGRAILQLDRETIERSQVARVSRVGFSANSVSRLMPSPGKVPKRPKPTPPMVTKRVTRSG